MESGGGTAPMPEGRGLEDKASIPDSIGDEYRVSAIKRLGFVRYLGRYRESRIGLNTSSESDRTIPALHDDYKASLWRFAEKIYSQMRYRTLPIEESELDRLTSPEEDAWLERWFGKIGIEDQDTRDAMYRELFRDQILAAKYILAERGYNVVSSIDQHRNVQSEQRNLRWWVVGAAAGILLIAAGTLIGTGWYVYKNYVKPFNKLRKDVESGRIVDRFPRYGITDSDIERIKDGFRKMTPQERRELIFGIPPSKKKDREEGAEEEILERGEGGRAGAGKQEEKKQLEENQEDKENPDNKSKKMESEF